jgi:hypothetical protein
MMTGWIRPDFALSFLEVMLALFAPILPEQSRTYS